MLDHLARRLDDRGAARHDRLRAAGAAAGDELVAVALQQADALEGDAEPRGSTCAKGVAVALAVVERAGDDGDRAVGLEADAAHLVHGRRGDLEILADAEAAQLAAGAALGLARREARPVGGLERALEQRREVARNRRWCRRPPCRASLGRDVVAAAQLDPVDAHLGGGGLDEPLHDVVALGAPGAAIGADRRRVGEDALDRHLDHRRAVDAGQVLGDVDRGRQRRDLA